MEFGEEKLREMLREREREKERVREAYGDTERRLTQQILAKNGEGTQAAAKTNP